MTKNPYTIHIQLIAKELLLIEEVKILFTYNSKYNEIFSLLEGYQQNLCVNILQCILCYNNESLEFSKIKIAHL